MERLALGERIVAVLKQKNHSPIGVAHQVCILFAVTEGCLKNIPVEKIPEFEKRLYALMDNRYPDVLQTICQTGELEGQTKERLSAAIAELQKEFL